jgi:hypothetical protein
MNKPKPIKPFKSLEEEAEFWDSHDLSLAFKKPAVPLSKLLLLKPEKQTILTLRLQKSIKKRLEKIAKLKGLNTSTLSRTWIIEKMFEFEKPRS